MATKFPVSQYIFFVFILPFILVVGTRLFACPFAIGQEQKVIPKRLYEPPTREELQIKLERLMLSKFMWPIDTWISTDVFENSVPGYGDTPRWFALVVEGEKVKGYPIFVKFYLDGAEVPSSGDSEGADDDDMKVVYGKRKRAGLFAALEHQFILLMDDPEAHEAIINGESHLYPIPTKDSDITLLRKRDRIY